MITADLIHIQYLLIFTFVIFLKPRNCKLYVSSNVIITYACHIGNWFLILPKSSYNRTFIQNMQNVIIHFFNTYIYSNYILKNSWPIVELGTIQIHSITVWCIACCYELVHVCNAYTSTWSDTALVYKWASWWYITPVDGEVLKSHLTYNQVAF